MIQVTVKGVVTNVDDIPDKSMDYQTYATVRANTEGFRALLPKLTNDALHHVFTYNYEPNASYRMYGVTYNDMLIGDFIPELLKRLKKPKPRFEMAADGSLIQIEGE